VSKIMWLPGPVYESLPYAYVAAGVLFISGTLYIGFSAPGAPLYITCGLISIVCGVAILIKRQVRRQKSTNPDSAHTA
jgi:hypothetical protein